MTVEIQLQEGAFAWARREVVEAHDELRRGRDALREDARELMAAGWRGVAADQYADAWTDWEEAAELVLRSLLELGEAMRVAHGGLSMSDSEAGHGVGRLVARLGAS